MNPRGRSGLDRPIRVDPSRLSIELRGLSTGKRWKLRRDIVIYLASRQGATQRMLGDVFDLPHSRISVILKTMRVRFASGH